MPDITTTQIFTDGEKGITATKMNNIIANSVIQPDFVTTKPSSATLDPTDQLLEVKGAGTYARITGSQLISSVSAQVDATPQIYSVRLRSFNSLSNPTFEADARNINAAVANIGNGIFACDRWVNQKALPTLAYSSQAITQSFPSFTVPAPVPNQSFHLSRSLLNIVLTTQQTTLAAGDYAMINQYIEGPRFRELSMDVHSLTLMGYTNVSGGIKIGISIRDPSLARSLVKLVTIGTSWTTIQLPNLPVWPTAGAFSWNPGAAGYIIGVTLAAGSTYMTPANDTWQNGNFFGALGQDNFGAKSLNSTIAIGFIQHEPGAVCSTPIDCPFTQNYDDCLRYYAKSYDYGTKAGTVTTNGSVIGPAVANQPPYLYVPFKRTMAKVPTVTGYNSSSGSANSVRDLSAAIDRTITSPNYPGDSSFGGFGVTTVNTSPALYQFHYVADTGW